MVQQMTSQVFFFKVPAFLQTVSNEAFLEGSVEQTT